MVVNLGCIKYCQFQLKGLNRGTKACSRFGEGAKPKISISSPPRARSAQGVGKLPHPPLSAVMMQCSTLKLLALAVRN